MILIPAKLGILAAMLVAVLSIMVVVIINVMTSVSSI